jgi:transposase InsO family protein
LASVIDLASSKVLGWCTDDNSHTHLSQTALEMPRLNGHVGPFAVFHSYSGSQYVSSNFPKFFTIIDLTKRLGKTGDLLAQLDLGIVLQTPEN